MKKTISELVPNLRISNKDIFDAGFDPDEIDNNDKDTIEKKMQSILRDCFFEKLNNIINDILYENRK